MASVCRFFPEMKSRPRIGEVGELDVLTDMGHAVEFAGDGMPAVVSTPNIIQFLERTARHTRAPHLEADERSVGLEIDIRQLAPTPVGQTIHCTARVIAVEGTKCSFRSKLATSRNSSRAACTNAPLFARKVSAAG